jgi:hypothetical protein
MIRLYSAPINRDIRNLLDRLIDKSTAPALYQQTMMQLGVSLGNVILERIDGDSASVYLASTVEDADFLCKGILERLETKLKSVALACFWNQRFSPFEVEDLQIAPILRKYQEPSQAKVDYLIVVKSIISGACVVRTNLIELIQTIDPEKILIVAPVIHNQSEEKLKRDFEPSISKKFQFIYFAQDDERTVDGEVVPGIGGMVYSRLGFTDQEAKNQYTPQLIKDRRTKLKI